MSIQEICDKANRDRKTRSSVAPAHKKKPPRRRIDLAAAKKRSDAAAAKKRSDAAKKAWITRRKNQGK